MKKEKKKHHHGSFRSRDLEILVCVDLVSLSSQSSKEILKSRYEGEKKENFAYAVVHSVL